MSWTFAEPCAGTGAQRGLRRSVQNHGSAVFARLEVRGLRCIQLARPQGVQVVRLWAIVRPGGRDSFAGPWQAPRCEVRGGRSSRR